MAQVVVRNLDNELKDALKRRAVNEETPQTGGNLGSRLVIFG